MVRRLFERLVLRPEDVPPSRSDLEVVGVFNPGAFRLGDEVILLVRVAERSRERRPGFTALPRWRAGELAIDWLADEDIQHLDARVVQRKADGLIRLTFLSHLRVVHCGDGRSLKSIGDVTFAPACEEEEYGVEDPRITPIDGRVYFTYVAVSRHGPATALAETGDFRTFKRHGIIFCPENKDVVLFPERIGNDYVALHRPAGMTPFTRPEMWLARSHDLIHWGQHTCVHGGVASWESGRIGAGPPPLRTPDGWLAFYHGNRSGMHQGSVGAYTAGALLLDLQDPARILRRTPGPILEPQTAFEREGFVPDVVFPTAIIDQGDTLLVYYGAADTCAAVVELSLDEVLEAMMS
jgi:predicted GH43/DUF377 family glycosyl hydrolase